MHRVLADADEVVTDISVTDGVTFGRVITFSTIRDGRICKQLEFWPDPCPAPEWRAQWVEHLEAIDNH